MPDNTRAPQFATPVYLAPAPGSESTNITTNGNTQVVTGPGYVTGISINTAGTTSTLKLYDGTDNTGPLLGTWSTVAQNALNLGGIAFTDGLFAVTAGGAAANITISTVAG